MNELQMSSYAGVLGVEMHDHVTANQTYDSQGKGDINNATG